MSRRATPFASNVTVLRDGIFTAALAEARATDHVTTLLVRIQVVYYFDLVEISARAAAAADPRRRKRDRREHEESEFSLAFPRKLIPYIELTSDREVHLSLARFFFRTERILHQPAYFS